MANKKDTDSVVHDDNIPNTGDVLTTESVELTGTTTDEEATAEFPESSGRWKLLSNGGTERNIGTDTPDAETRARSDADAGEDAGELVTIVNAEGMRYRVSRLAFRDLYEPHGFTVAE